MRNRTKQARGGIERKFIRSIVWVGVVPMTLALIIGYVFARESQWIATQQNQATTARKTAEGVWLALEDRLLMASRVAMNPEYAVALREHRDDHRLPEASLRKLFELESSLSDSMHSTFWLYDGQGDFLFGQAPVEEEDRAHPEWLQLVNDTRFTTLRSLDDKQGYVVIVVSPILDPESGERLGFLAEAQGLQDLMDFALGRGPNPEEGFADDNSYQVVYLGPEIQFATYYEENLRGGAPALHREKVDNRLAERLRRSPDKDHDSFFLWRFGARGQTRPVLMAYHRLFPAIPLYFVAYRPVSAVFANINLGAVLTVVVSGIAIAIFCVIGYRIVNNNIIRPVSLLNEGAQIIRQGDFELKLRIDTGDEIEELASSFNKMAATLRQNIKRLEDSEEKYRSLITSMRDGIYQCDTQGVLTFINPAGAAILGYSRPQEALGITLRDVFREEMDFTRVARELAQNRFVEHSRIWIQTPHAQPICVEISANGIFDEADRFVGVEGAFRDVTQNVRLEQQARERSERISAINHLTNVINSSLEAGRVYENIVVELRKLVHLDYASLDLLRDEAKLSEFAPSGAPFKTRRLWPETVSGVRGVSASPLGEQWVPNMEHCCAAWVAREHRCLIIDDFRLAEEPFLSQFPVETQSAVCVPLHAAGRIIGTLNLGAVRPGAFGQHEVEVLQQLTPHLAVAIRNAQLLENLQQSLEEVTQARERLHEVNEELKTLDEMKTNLLSNVSHELRTPLVAVMGYTDMILNAKVGPINEVQREYLGISLRNIEKLVTLIENLLDFSRLHRGAEEMVFDTLDLVDCARTSMQIVRPVADSRNIALILQVRRAEGDAPPAVGGDASEDVQEVVLVEGDKGKLGQVFNNLLSNATKFNENGGSVTIDMQVGDSAVDVSVIDTGIGIPEEALDKVFTRFYQYDGSSTRKYGGTGIGLAIAQDIMRLHGSRITVSSTLGKGSIFRFSMPLSGSRQRGREGDTADSRGLPIPTETHLLIEVVTQDRALSAQIRNLLLSEGMDVIHAAYPAVAVSLANRYNPDCIVVDTEAGPLGSIVMDEILSGLGAEDAPVCLLTNDDALYARYQKRISGRIRRGFRKSTLLSGIHYALSRGVAAGEQLGRKILCVDDDAEIVCFIARCLEAEDYQTDQCVSGEEALERVESGEYWLVLLDLAMPGLDGWETCRRMKSNAALAGLKVYIVTAKPIDKSMERIHENGADGYLSKPFKAEDLVELVKSVDHR